MSLICCICLNCYLLWKLRYLLMPYNNLIDIYYYGNRQPISKCIMHQFFFFNFLWTYLTAALNSWKSRTPSWLLSASKMNLKSSLCWNKLSISYYLQLYQINCHLFYVYFKLFTQKSTSLSKFLKICSLLFYKLLTSSNTILLRRESLFLSTLSNRFLRSCSDIDSFSRGFLTLHPASIMSPMIAWQ